MNAEKVMPSPYVHQIVFVCDHTFLFHRLLCCLPQLHLHISQSKLLTIQEFHEYGMQNNGNEEEIEDNGSECEEEQLSFLQVCSNYGPQIMIVIVVLSFSALSIMYFIKWFRKNE